MSKKTKKNKFYSPYIGIETVDEKGFKVTEDNLKNNTFSIFYNKSGDFSIILHFKNPVLQYCANIDEYYNFYNIFSNLIKLLGAGYTIQKQDIFCKKKYNPPKRKSDYLSEKYFDHFKGRPFIDISTYLVITCQLKQGTLFSYDKKIFDLFLRNITRVLDLFHNKGIEVKLLNEKEIQEYIHRCLALNYDKKVVNLENIKVTDESLYFGKRAVKCVSVVDIDEVNFPSKIRPCKEVNVGMHFPVDLMTFLHQTPAVDTLVYNQVIIIPNQRIEQTKLETKKKRHAGMPDPANAFCVEDIDKVQADIARDGGLLVYAHYNLIFCGTGDITKSINFVEANLFDSGIVVSHCCYNQLELFENFLPGNATNLKDYDKFLTTSDAAICLFYKESVPQTEDSPFLTYFTDRQGVPVGIDLSGKEGEIKLTNNANKFVLGPSGSGKSFYMNAVVRQYRLENTDVVLVDTGHSYSGICQYYGGRYITYSEEKPITMNPFKISKEEYNEEKREFLKSLISLLWKGTDGSVSQVEDTLLTNVISEYYEAYFEHKIKSLGFNSFYEFALVEIERSVAANGIHFDLKSFRFILKKFYRGGEYEKILNDDIDSSLFDEPFIVFEIDSIKEHKILFPIVTLIIMDVFIHKMRLKKNRKALIIEEAWKAIASPMMANYILYLYKTVRKFWGEAMVVTQELDDIINNPVVKNSIINNSDIICLLDQTKFKDNYNEIAALLALGEVEKRKIFTVNKLDNHEGRARFNEVYIRRGSIGNVFGVEVSKHEYFTFTTERIEKDAVSYYTKIYGNFQDGLDRFIEDMEKSGLKQNEWVRQVNKVLGNYSENGKLQGVLSNSENLHQKIIEAYSLIN